MSSDVLADPLVKKVYSVAGGKRMESLLPEAALGFAGFRKIEILRVAWAWDLPIDENLPTIDRAGGPCLSDIMDAYNEQGAFDKPPKYPEKLKPGVGSIAEQGQEVNARKERIRELEARVVLNQRELAALKAGNKLTPKDTAPKIDPAGVQKFTWHGLRKRAVELGIKDIHGMKRPQLEAAVREAEASGEDVSSSG